MLYNYTAMHGAKDININLTNAMLCSTLWTSGHGVTLHFNAMQTIILQDTLEEKAARYATNLPNALSYVLCYIHLKKINHDCGHIKCSTTITWTF